MKQFITSLLVLACLTSAYAAGCVANTDTIEIFPSLKEQKKWNLHDGIFSGEDLTFQIITDTIFKIQNPLEQTGGSSSHIQTSDPIRAVKPLHTKKMQSWLNSFVFLSQGVTEVSLYFAQGNSLDKIPTPGFNKKVKIADVADNLQCYDVEFIDSDKQIVDCQKEITEKGKQKYIDVFYIYSVSQNKVTSFEEESFDKIYNKRTLGLFYYTSVTGKELTHIVRVTPSYSLQQDGSLSGNSLVSVYLLNDNYTITPINYVLDDITMALLLGKTEMEFNIVDVEISYNGFIFLQDAQYGLFVVQFQSTGSWELFAQADLKLGKIYAFDIDFEHKKDGSELGIVAILGYDFFTVLDAEKSYIQKLPFIQLDYPASIKLTENHVIVRNNEFAYIYTLDVEGDKISLLTKLAVTANDILLVNPYEPDIIEINTRNSYRYTISTGYLKYDGHTAVQAQKSFMIKATAPNKQECQVFVMYQIIENNENWIYQLPTKPVPFPKTITEVPTQQFLKRLASGPNLQYSLNVESNVKVDVETRIELDVNGWPQDVIYAEVVSQDSHTRFYQAFQTKDFKLQIWICEHKSLFSDDTVCEMYLNDINIGYKATKDNFSIWLKNGIVYFLQLDNLYSLSIKTIKSSIVFLEKQIQLDNSDTDNQIVSILNCGDYLLIRKADKTISSYLTYRPETFALTTINGETFSQYGYQKEWEPVSWFTNKKLHPNLVFIVHTTHILILDTDYGYFGFIKNIDIAQGREYSVAIGQNTFFLVQSKSAHDATDARIFEYNFESINNVYLQKELHLFWYDISLPLQVDFSEDNGFMFVRGVCLYCSKSFIIVFQPNVLLHDVLVQAWNFADVVIPETTPIILSADGAYQTYLYLNSEGQQWLTSLFDQPTIAIEAKIDSLAYSVTQDLELKIRNYNFAGKPEKFNTIQIKQNIRTISTQTTIKFDETKFGPSKGVIVLDTEKTKTVELGTEWYQGQIGLFEVDCDQCETNISLTSTVDLLKQKMFNGYEIRDQVKYNDKYNILQATKGLLFLNTDGTLASVYDFDLPSQNYKCYQATVSKDSMVVYSLCHDGEQYTVYATGCFSITGCSPLGEKFKLGTASKIQVVDNEVLVVLHTDALKLDQGEVVIYRIVMSLDAWRLEIIDVINLNTLNSRLTTKFNDFKPADFSVVRQQTIDLHTYNFKLFIQDSLSGFIFIDFTLNNLAKYQFQGIETLNLHSVLNNDLNQYTLPTTKFLSFQFIFSPDYDWSSRMLRTHILVLSSDTSHYGIRVFFKESDQKTVIEKKGICAIINRYGWDTVNKIAIHSNQYLAIPYIKDKEIVVAIYNFEVELFDEKPNLTPAVMIGSYRLYISDDQWVHPLNMALFFDNRNYKKLYVSQFSGAMASYGINQSPIIMLDNSDKSLEDQLITITAKNDFSEANIQFQLIVQGTNTKECTTIIPSVSINPSNGEVVLWDLTQSFFEGLALKYSVDSQQTDFSVIQPTTQIGNSVTHIQAANQIISAKALLTENQLWTHQFAFLNKNNTKYHIFYTKTVSLNTAPSFSEVYTVQKADDNLNCFDFAELSTTIFTIDCQINNNKFLILIKDNVETYTADIQNNQIQRRLGSYVLNKNHFVVRVTLSITNEGDLANNSFVELFQLQGEKLNLIGTLDKAKLQTISGMTIDQLNIVDFKIGTNGWIYLLDAKMGCYFVVYFDTDWVLTKFKNFEISQLFAFDIEVQEEYEYITVLAYNYYAQFQKYFKPPYKIQDLTTHYTTYPQRISASQGFVYLYDQAKLSIYHTASKDAAVVDLVHLPNGAFIVNPLTSEIVTITFSEASRWYISLGSLQFTGTAQAFNTPKNLKITATSANHITCSANILYSVHASDSQTLVKQTMSDSPFPEVVDEFTEVLSLMDFVSAPNLQYQSPNAASLKIDHNQRLEVTGIPAKIIYSAGVVGYYDETIIQVFQTDDKKIRVYECPHEKYNPTQVTCKYYGSVQVQQQQNDQVFRIWPEDYGRFPRFYALHTEYILQLYEYSIKDSTIELIDTIAFDAQEGNQIVSVLNSYHFVSILQKNGQLTIRGALKATITGESLVGYTGNWNPKKLFGNINLQQNLIFVQNADNIAIIQIESKEASFIAKIDFPINNEISLSLGKNTFFLLSNQELQEYSYRNLRNIFKIQTVELYGYQIVNPQQAISYQKQGNLLVKATKNQQNYLISFKAGKPKHETFYFSMQVSEFTAQTAFLLSSAGSSYGYQYTFLITETKSILYLLSQNPYLIVEPNFKEQIFVQNLELEVKISNQDTKQSVTYKQTVKETSTFLNLLVSDETYLNTLEIESDDCPQEFLIKNDWVTGQLSQVELKLEKTTDDISLLPYVQNSQTWLGDYYFTHAIQSDTTTFLQTSNNILFYLGEDVQNAKPLLQNLSDQYYCYRIEKSQNRLYSLCDNGVVSQIQITTCNDQLVCQREHTEVTIPNAVQILALEKDYIAILHGDQVYPERFDGSVVIYKLNQVDTIWQLTALLTIDYQFVKDKMGAKALNQFRPSSIQVSLTEQSYYQLIIVDSVNGLLYLDFNLVSATSTVNFLYLEYTLLKQWLNQNNQYASTNTVFFDAKIINSVIANKKKTLDVIVVTDISASYLLKIEFAIQTDKSNKLTTLSTSLAFNKPVRSHSFYVSASPKFVAIAAFDNSIKVQVHFYSLPKTTDAYQVLTELGSYEVNLINRDRFLILAQNDYVLVSSSKKGFVVYNLRSQLALKFGDPEKLNDQKLTLAFQNVYTKVEREIKLTVKTSVVDVECKTKSTNLKIYPSTGESLVWSLAQNIFEGVSLKYAIDQATDFTVAQSLVQVGNSVAHVQAANLIVSAKALMTPNQVWVNQFAFLNKNANKYHIFYTKTASLNAAPSFTELYTVKKTDDNLICYDYVELSTTTFTIDCQINNNKFLVLVKDNEETYTTNIQNTQTQRRLGSYQVNGIQFVIRVTLSITNDGDLDNNSFVELFQLTNNQLVSKETLDKAKLATIYGKAIDQLNIVDFKIGANGAIYLLDAKIGIFVVSYDTDWKLQRLVTYKVGQTFAFDRAVLQSNNQEVFTLKCYNYFVMINAQGKILKVQDLSISTITYPQYIKQSQKYVFYSYQSKLYIYHSDDSNSSLIDIINLTNAAAIINPVNQDLVLVSLTNSQRWSFSLGLLQFNQQAQPTQAFKDLTITATSLHNQICTSKIKYQIIAGTSQAVIKTVDTDEPFPSVLDENNEQFRLGSLVSGPNLVYSFTQANDNKFLDELLLDNDVDIQIVQNRKIQVSDWPMKTKYQTSLVGNNQETLYQVFQKEDNKITISKCELVDHVKYSCTDFSSEQVHTELSDQLFSIWQQDTIVKFITVDTSYIIKAFSVKDGKTDLDYTIKIDEEDETKQILSFLNQGDNVFVLHKNGELSSYNGDKLISSIIKLDGFDGEWKPLKLYGNRILKPNLLIVENENNIVLINYFHDEYVYVSTIAKAAQSQVFVTLSTTTFFVVINQKLEEYNYEYLNKVYKQKTVELFGYQIVNPLAATTQLAKGNLVVKTLKGEDTYVSIFKPGQTQHDTFYLAFKVEGVAAENDLTLTSGGSAYIVTLLNSEKFQQFNFILLQPELIVIPTKKKHIYISDTVIQIKITNADSANNEIVFKQTVKVVNKFTNIIVDETKALKAIEIKPKTNSTNVLIDNAWITGQLPFSYLQAANLSQISFSPYLNSIKTEVFKERQFRAAVAFQKQLALQTTTNILYVKDGDLTNAKALFKDDLESQYNCFAIDASGSTLYSLCNNGVENQIQVVTCEDINNCKRQDAYISAPQAIQIAAIQQGILVLLHTDSSNPEDVDGKLTIQKLAAVDDIWSSTLLFTLDYQFIKNKMGAQAVAAFRPSSFQVSNTGEDNDSTFVQLIITDSVNGILSFDISISKATQEIKYIYLEYILLTKWLNENKQYASDLTHYYSGQIVEQTIKEQKKTVSFAIVTDNASSFIFSLEFAIQENKSNKLTQTKVTETLNRYGSVRAMNKIAANANTVIIPYQNDDHVIVGVYQIVKDAPAQVIHGSYSFLIENTFEPVDFLLHLQDKKLIASSVKKGVNEYEIREQMQISFGDSKLISNQTLTLLVSNDYKYTKQEIALNVLPDNDDDNDGGSSNAWWIILIVAGVLLAVGLLGFLLYKKRKTALQDDDQDGYEPIN